jgi:putative transposase
VCVAGAGAFGRLRAQIRDGDERPRATRRIDELHLKLPFYGSRRMMFELNKESPKFNRKYVQRLMRLMGIVALIPRPDTSKPAPGHEIYPYLLRGVAITEPNQV